MLISPCQCFKCLFGSLKGACFFSRVILWFFSSRHITHLGKNHDFFSFSFGKATLFNSWVGNKDKWRPGKTSWPDLDLCDSFEIRLQLGLPRLLIRM